MCNFMKDKRRRLYEIIAYSENNQFVDLMPNIMHLTNLRWYWSYHDKDKYDKDMTDDKGNVIHHQGDLKKPHYHILLYFKEGCTLSAVSKKTKCSESMINFYKEGTDENRLDYRVRYLIHYKSKTEYKFEYDIEHITTNDENIEKFFTEDTRKSSSDINLIFDFFDSHESQLVSYRTFLNYIYSNNLWGTFRQNALIFNRLFDEHNTGVKGEALAIFSNTPCYNSNN